MSEVYSLEQFRGADVADLEKRVEYMNIHLFTALQAINSQGRTIQRLRKRVQELEPPNAKQGQLELEVDPRYRAEQPDLLVSVNVTPPQES